MKLFKTIDVSIQLFLLLAAAFIGLKDYGNNDFTIYIAALGCFQVISSLVHFFLKIKKTGWRLSYSIAGLLILVLLLAIKLDIVSESTFILTMLVTIPIMGIYYCILSCVETTQYYKLKNTGEDLIEV